MRRLSLFAALLLTASSVLAQISRDDISGTWTGNYYGGIGLFRPNKVVVELSVYDDSLITGSSHLYYGSGQFEHYKVGGVWHAADSTIYFSEDSTLGLYLIAGSNCLGNYSMKLAVTDTMMRFDGRWRDNDNSFLHCPSTRVYLERPRKAALSAAPPKDKTLERKEDIQSLIEIAPAEMDSIRVEILDNAEIDGDVVSIFQDDKLIVKKQRLTAEPYVFYLSVSKDAPLCRIKIAAESMGSILPCTAHMIVTTSAGRKYEIDLASNYNNNGVLELFMR